MVSTDSLFTFFLITQDLDNNCFQTLLNRKRVQNFRNKILKLVGARQSFQFSRQTAWFLGKNRALS